MNLGRDFRLKPQNQGTTIAIVLILLVVFVVLQLMHFRPMHRIHGALSFFGSTTSQALYYTRLNGQLRKDIQERDAALTHLAIERSELITLQQENEQLRRLVSFTSERSDLDVHPANVIARSLNLEESHILIDAGSAQGVRDGFAVIVEEGVLIGTVLDAREHTSVVELITDRNSRVAGKARTQDTIGIGEGTKGILLSFQFIPQATILDVNDLVTTSGLEGVIPPNLILGLVTGIESDDTQPFKMATVEPLTDPRHHAVVGVILAPEL